MWHNISEILINYYSDNFFDKKYISGDKYKGLPSLNFSNLIEFKLIFFSDCVKGCKIHLGFRFTLEFCQSK